MPSEGSESGSYLLVSSTAGLQLRNKVGAHGRVVFNIKANHYRLVALVQYQEGVLMIRFFGSHQEYDQIDAETV